MHFAAEKRDAYKKPQMPASQVAKALGDVWRDMSNEEKEPYETLAATDKKRYLAELASFQEAGGVMQTKARKVKGGGKKNSKANNSKATGEKNKIPRAPSAYNLFVKERMSELKKSSEKKVSELMKEIGKEWSELSDAQKTPFVDQAAAAKASLQASEAA
jgi:arsenate reductase-like glutaredoxin family protein